MRLYCNSTFYCRRIVSIDYLRFSPQHIILYIYTWAGMLNNEAEAKEDKECKMETTNVFEEYVVRREVQSFQA